jgi:poly(glycerol-phosphate) alpha-glucosyltransferase
MLDAWALKNSALRKRLAWGAYQRRHLARAACIRALCGQEARSVRALGLKNPICVIPNGVDLPASDSNHGRLEDSDYLEGCDTRSASLASAIRGRRVLLYLGRLHPKKGLFELLRAWAMVPKRNDWLLVIAGWDQCGFEAKLKALASTLSLNWTEEPFELRSDVSLILAGPRFGTAKQNLLQACHACVLPSISEGLPMAVLEAWAHAKPVLMTAQCNLHQGFVAGAAIRIGPDALAIAAGLEELFRASDCTVTEFGTRGRRLVAERYAWPAVAGQLGAVYHWMLGTGSRPSCVLND